jgi:hypothetical protein
MFKGQAETVVMAFNLWRFWISDGKKVEQIDYIC